VPVHVLIAPDKFTGSLTGAQVAAAVDAGLRDVLPDVRTTRLPVADGGDGTVDAFVAAGWRRVALTASGPTGSPVETSYARRGDTAVVELANACGRLLLPGGLPDPLGASTYGLGEVVAAALDAGATRIVLGLGGSASTDGGAGFLQALGASVRDEGGADVRRGGAALADVASVDLAGLHPALAAATVVVAGDVDNPLCGPHGAAAVYGPQKGATAQDVAVLDAALAHFAAIVAGATGRDLAGEPGAGAAGGTGFGALVLGAQIRSGIELVLELIGFPAALADADLVITGEGSLDRQTLAGKAPVGVAVAARRQGVPVVALAGRCLLDSDEIARAGFASVRPLSAVEPDPARSIANAAVLVRRVAADLATELAAGRFG